MPSTPFLHVYHPEISRARTTGNSCRGSVRKAIDAVANSNRRKAEWEIARFIQHNGDRISDGVERAIERGSSEPGAFPFNTPKPWSPVMTLITALRFIHSVFVEARKLQSETHKRYLHRRQD